MHGYLKLAQFLHERGPLTIKRAIELGVMEYTGLTRQGIGSSIFRIQRAGMTVTKTERWETYARPGGNKAQYMRYAYRVPKFKAP